MREYYGWRARIGLIYLAPATVMEPEFYAMAPEGVSIHTTRVPLSTPTVEGLSKTMEGDTVEQAARLLGDAPLHCVVFGGTSASFLHGLGWDVAVLRRLQSILGGTPVTTTSSASIEALRAVGATRISFVGPYVDEVTERGRAFFTASGFDVVGAHGMRVTSNWDINAVPLQEVYRFTKSVVDQNVDAVFISCTGMRSVGAIEALEQDLGVPVVTAVQASFWHALKLAKVGASVPGFGSLLSR